LRPEGEGTACEHLEPFLGGRNKFKYADLSFGFCKFCKEHKVPGTLTSQFDFNYISRAFDILCLNRQEKRRTKLEHFSD